MCVCVCVCVSAGLVPAAPGHGTNSDKTQTPPGDLSQPVTICILLVPWGPPHMVPSWHADSEVVEDMLASLVMLIFVSPADSWPRTHTHSVIVSGRRCRLTRLHYASGIRWVRENSKHLRQSTQSVLPG